MFVISLLCGSLFAGTAHGNWSRQSVAVAEAHCALAPRLPTVSAGKGHSRKRELVGRGYPAIDLLLANIDLLLANDAARPAHSQSNQGNRTKVQQKGAQRAQWRLQYLGIPTGPSGVFFGIKRAFSGRFLLPKSFFPATLAG